MNHEIEIKEKTTYCLHCQMKPCQKGCPLENDIPSFIQYLKEENYREAFKVLTETTVLGAVCGRICPHQKQCQGNCVRGIKSKPVSIGELEAYTFDIALANQFPIAQESQQIKNKKIAIIGSGPAGLTCAAFLARNGAEVTLYERQEELGGILRYGIPRFRLDKKTLDKTIYSILDLGIQVKTNQILGDTILLEELEKKQDAIFLGIGANCSRGMGIPGENLKGVFGGNELLESGNHPSYTNKKVAVIGGGNVAMDTARTIKKLGAQEVKIIYRRAEKQMPAERKEIEDAKEEGIEFLFQNNPVKIVGDEEKQVQKIECIKTTLVKKEGEAREIPIEIEGSNYEMAIDYVVMAIGSQTNAKRLKTLGLETTQYGYVKVDENYQTTRKKIYAGGDLIGTKSTVAWAARSGREAAKAIIQKLQS